MPRCALCGSETQLYVDGVPLCPDRSERQEKRERARLSRSDPFDRPVD